MGKKESKKSSRGSLYDTEYTLNPTPTSFTINKDETLTFNPTPLDFIPSEHDDLTRNPTPDNFNVDLSPLHQTTSEPTYQPTNLPTYAPSNKPTTTHSPSFEPTFIPSNYEPTYEPSTYEPSPDIATARTGLVPDMRAIIPGWDLNAGSTWTVVILFFLVVIGVLFLFVYNIFFKQATEKIREEAASSNDGEADPLLNIPKAPYFPFGPPKTSTTMARVNSLHTDALKEFFASGKVLELHTSKGKKTVEISLAGTDLRWKTINDIFPKKFKLEIKTVTNIEIGKKTDNFKKINALDDVCLSLISDKTTLDIEAKSKADRDIMAEGFREIIENLKGKSSSV